MNLRAFLGTALTAGTLVLSGPLGVPAHADAGATNIDHVEVSDEGTVSMLLAVDGLPAGSSPDLDSVAVELNGEPVEVTAEPIRAGQIERTTVLAFDASRSMAGARFEAAKEAAKSFLDAAPGDVQIGLLTFSGGVHDVIAPTTDHAELAEAIDQIELTRGTLVYDAVVQAVELTGDQGARSVLVLSDGEDQGNGTPLADAVEAARSGGVVVDVIAIEQAPTIRAMLAQIADASGGNVIEADDPAALEGVFTAQADALATQILVKFSQPAGVPEEASLSVSLTTDGETYTDTAFVTLSSAAENSGPKAVDVKEPLLDETGLWIGGAALAMGLVGLLSVVLIGGSRQPSLAQRQLAHHSGNQQGEQRVGSGPAPATPSLRDSAVAITEKLVKGDFETRLAQKLNGAGLALTAAEWLLLHAGIAVASAFVGLLLKGPALMVVLLATGAVVPWLYLRFKHSRRLAAFNAQLAETLQLIAGGLSAGLSLAQSIDTVVREGHDPIAGEMRRALIEQRLGIEIEDALDGIAVRMASEDFAWIVMAVRIQREVGGNLAEVLNTVAETIRERDYLRRQVKVLSAEGRISAYVLGALPILMFVFMVVFRPEIIGPMFTDTLGLLLLLGAVVLLLGGFFTMSKLVKVEV